MSALQALIWDVDGTVAETERDGHRVAFNAAFEAAGLPWRWGVAEYGALLQVAGGRERLLHDMARRPDAPADTAAREALALELHALKNRCYAALVARGGIAARPGVLRLMAECRQQGVALAVATTTGRRNVQALFDLLIGPAWPEHFGAVVCAEDAPAKKPDPQAYDIALDRLGLAPAQALALEDSPNGLRAARAAGIACGITRSAYFADATFEGAAWVRDDLEAPPAITLAGLRRAHSGSIAAPSLSTARP
ncbi:MAG: HAD-IA family hydrolase [Burkholderiales bacterium]|nr:HAD-IA family hydrolase [Burkholderiales bacterium]